jgi:hypothetical protein
MSESGAPSPGPSPSPPDDAPTTPPDDTGHSSVRRQAVRTQNAVERGRTILRIVAVVAAILWLVAILSLAISAYHQLNNSGTPAVNVPNLLEQNPHVDGWNLLSILAGSLQTTWGYALVAVAAYIGSMWFDDARARDLFELLDEVDGPPSDA